MTWGTIGIAFGNSRQGPMVKFYSIDFENVKFPILINFNMLKCFLTLNLINLNEIIDFNRIFKFKPVWKENKKTLGTKALMLSGESFLFFFLIY